MGSGLTEITTALHNQVIAPWLYDEQLYYYCGEKNALRRWDSAHKTTTDNNECSSNTDGSWHSRDRQSINMKQQYSNTDTDSITCFYTNADSLLNKRSELLMHVHNMQPRIIAITEVQPKNSSTAVLESEFHIENYQCYLSAPGGRGVLLYIHNTLESMEVVIGHGTYVDAVWCTVTMNGTDKLLVGCVYHSPNISTSDEEQLNDMLIQACCFKVSHKLIMGDFNHPDIDWITGTCCRGPGHSAVAFLDIVNDAFLFQHCLEPTHSRPGQVHNTLDLVFTDEEEMIGDLEYITPLGKSQHVIIQFSLTCRTRLKNTAADTDMIRLTTMACTVT